MRIYSNYSEEEYNLIVKESKEMGLSLSAYQKYCSLLRLDRNNNTPLPDLISEMFDSLSKFECDTPFIVASLLPDKWVSLSRSQKITLSKKLSNEIKKNPSNYKKIGTVNGTTSQYMKFN